MQTELYRYRVGILPASAYDLAFSTMEEVVESSSGGKSTLGLFVTSWFASAGIDSLRNALNSVYEVDESRLWWKTKLQSLVLTLLFILLVAIALTTVTAGVRLLGAGFAAAGFDITSPWEFTLVQGTALLVTMLFATAVVYSWLPSFEEFHWVWISPGAIFAIVLWVLLTVDFAFTCIFLTLTTLPMDPSARLSY